ncbi:MAG: 50S ribosomal protein L17 [Candidatus Zambryskibacteria bacterium]|nr:50S ribosomal protein L17 [Candidatus Zambryskibacteria bacterium]
MRHHNANRKFGRKTNQRNALLKSLAYSLALKGKIKTTEAKAKELRPYMEKLVTLGKKETLASRRLLESRVGKEAAKKIATDLAPSYKERAGGYLRITKMVRRKSDGAPQAVIEFV